MKLSYEFLDENGEENQVTFGIIQERNAIRPYGIRAEIFRNGKLAETAEATERFLSSAEAEQVMKLLCRFQVTPCTLCDVI